MRIRPACLADIDTIHALVQRAYAPYVARIGHRPAPMDDDFVEKVAEGVIFVADDAGVIGALVLIGHPDHLLIENIAVAPHRHGEGVGRALLTFAEMRALGRGTPMLRLYTNAAMTENIALYSRLGYQETKRCCENGFERVYFAKHLASTSSDR